MRKTIAAATVAASVAVSGVAGAILGAPSIAGAQDAGGGVVGWVEEALDGLVDEGTITEEQADAVETALAEARPERGPRGFRLHGALGVVAEALGMPTDELRTALGEDRTIADIAEEQGVEVQTVIDALVTAKEERLAERVTDGDLTQEEADEILGEAEERATALVEGELRELHRGPHRHGWRDGGGEDEDAGS